jgi:uncharacterized 2Fe-2S/4Fe-4S cluster protein (DUF4445 family)
LIGGFVGADALACLAYFGFDRMAHPALAVDLGTNGEIMLIDGKRILATSAAAGPAFEGVNISSGCHAVERAITRVRLKDGAFQLETIGGSQPVGLTGSGLISAVRVLREARAIEPGGRLNPASPYVRSDHLKKRIIPLRGDIAISQGDVRELQKAKGAIRAAVSLI